MLSQFSFGNFKSFKSEALLDLTPANIFEHNSHLIEGVDGEAFLPLAVLYGPNGAGKSTVLEGLQYLSAIILKPILTLRVTDENQEKKDTVNYDGITFGSRYYKFEEKYKKIPTTFDVLFRKNENEFKYQLEILENEIVEENLYMRKVSQEDVQIVFERSTADVVLGDVLGNISADKVKSTIPLLSHLSIAFDIDIIDDVVEWFLEIDFIDYDDPILDKNIIIPKNEKVKKALFDMFKEIDIQISGVRIEKDSEGKVSDIFVKHILSNRKTVEIPIEEESSGTRKLFSLLPRLLIALMNGNLVVADEMDAKLHPKLLRYIIELFTRKETNKNGAQLLFTSHDLTTMVPTVFRRDEIWFCALSSKSDSKLYSLVEFTKETGSKVRKDEAYGKQYFEGRYGADPYFRRILDWEKVKYEQ